MTQFLVRIPLATLPCHGDVEVLVTTWDDDAPEAEVREYGGLWRAVERLGGRLTTTEVPAGG